MRTYPVHAIANALVHLHTQRGLPVTHLRLQKLTYLAHAWHLAFYDRPLVHAPVEAWEHGPIFPTLYEAYKPYQEKPITRLPNSAKRFHVPLADQRAWDLLDNVVDAYQERSHIELSAIAKYEGTPWQQTWANNPNRYPGMPIPDELIERHYKQTLVTPVAQSEPYQLAAGV